MNQFLFAPMITGLILVISGLIFQKFPPKKINSWIGYKTKNSMKSQERWNFAQIYSSQQTVKFGSLLTLTSFLGFLFQFEYTTKAVFEIVLVLLFAFLLIFSTEQALKTKFGEN